jgi:hypothetical protein
VTIPDDFAALDNRMLCAHLDTSTLIARFMLSEDRYAAEEINRRIPTNALCGAHQGQVAPCLLCLQAQVTRDYHDLKALREHVAERDESMDPFCVLGVINHSAWKCETCGAHSNERHSGPREKGTQLVAAPPSPPSSDAGVVVAEANEPTSPTTPGRRPEAVTDKVIGMIDTLVSLVRRANREVKDGRLHALINDDLDALLKEIEQ